MSDAASKAETSGGSAHTGGALAGVRIIDLTSVVVGPLATQILADHGADVIKVETPAGDLVRTLAGVSRSADMSPKYLHLNRNKRSIVLDLKQPAGHAALMRLIATADVLIWNVRPAAMARLGLAWDDVRAVNPKLIYCGMFGFGQDGRYRDKPAYDTIIQGAAGMSALFHRATGEPRFVPMVVADKVCGLIAVQMIAMALYQRTRTGVGTSIEIPMFENFAKFVLEEHMYLKTFEPPLGETGDQRLLDPQGKPVATKDGWISISANTDGQVMSFFDAIGRPDLKTDLRFASVASRFNHVADYFEIRSSALIERTTAAWVEIFDTHDVPAMPYHTLDDVLADPHLADVGFFEIREHPTEGKIRNMRAPNAWPDGLRGDWRPAPKLGQNSVEVLREAGFSTDEIGRMVAERVTLDGRPAGPKTAT